jgi:hypothetical protein
MKSIVKVKIHFVTQFFATFLKIVLHQDCHCIKAFATGVHEYKLQFPLTLATNGIYPLKAVLCRAKILAHHKQGSSKCFVLDCEIKKEFRKRDPLGVFVGKQLPSRQCLYGNQCFPKQQKCAYEVSVES